MTSPCVCPNCGFDLRRVEEVSDGPYSADAAGVVYLHGAAMPILPQGHLMLAALLRSKGRTVSHEAIIGQIGSEADFATNVVRSLISRARIAAARLGAPLPVSTVWGRGYRWDAMAVAS